MAVPLTESQLLEMIATLDAAILDLIAGKVKSYRIGERQFTRYDLTQLREIRKEWQLQIESIPTGIPTVFDDPDM